MEKWRKRRALPTQFNIRGAKIPYNRLPQSLRQRRAIAHLVRAPPARLMRQRLPVKAYKLSVRTAQSLRMCPLHNLKRRL